MNERRRNLRPARTAVVAIACLLGCVTSDPVYTIAPGQAGAPGAKRFAVLPMNALVPIAPELRDATGRALGTITRYLGAQGRERAVVEPLRARDLWLASVAEVGHTGGLTRDFVGAMKLFAPKLAEAEPYDVLVVPSLVYRRAQLIRQRATWDGAVRRIDDAEDEALIVPAGFKGVAPAVSLHVMVFDPRGERLFENYGGVDLAHALTLPPGERELFASLRDPVLGDRDHLDEGVELAFVPYLPRLEGAW